MNQAGSGIAGFQGVRYQHGSGFMGRMISGTIMPVLKKILPFLGKTALNTGSNILQDFENGEKISDSAKKRLKETKELIKMKAADKFKQLTGGARRRRKKSTKNKRRTRKPNPRKRRAKSKRIVRKKYNRRRNKNACDFL